MTFGATSGAIMKAGVDTIELRTGLVFVGNDVSSVTFHPGWKSTNRSPQFFMSTVRRIVSRCGVASAKMSRAV